MDWTHGFEGDARCFCSMLLEMACSTPVTTGRAHSLVTQNPKEAVGTLKDFSYYQLVHSWVWCHQFCNTSFTMPILPSEGQKNHCKPFLSCNWEHNVHNPRCQSLFWQNPQNPPCCWCDHNTIEKRSRVNSKSPADYLKSTEFFLSRYKILSIKYFKILPLERTNLKPDKIKQA